PPQPDLPPPHRESRKHRPPGQPPDHLHDPVSRARRRSRQKSRRRSLPLRQWPHRPPRPKNVRQARRTNVHRLPPPPRTTLTAAKPHRRKTLTVESSDCQKNPNRQIKTLSFRA